MIIVESYKDNLIRTYSSLGYYIERDGVRYSEAIDPAEFGRTYVETDEPIEEPEAEDEAAVEDCKERLYEMY